MNRAIVAAGILGSLLSAGCAADGSTHTDTRSAQFKSNLAGPPGAARVYLLPTYSKGLFLDLDGRASFAIFPEGSEHGAGLGATSKSGFLAFDIGPGAYDIQARGDDPSARVIKPFDFQAGKTYVLRPAFFRSAQDMPSHYADVRAGMGFDIVPPSDAAVQLAGLEMIALTPGGEAFINRTMAGAAPSVAQPAASAASPDPAPRQQVTTPDGGDDFAGRRRKLQELKQLREDGLITEQDYDNKRNAILGAY